MTPLDLTTWLPVCLREKWHGRPISVLVPAAPTPVVADPARLAQVIDIVVGNAFQHGATGTEVILTVARRGGDILLTVVNDGTNIPEAERGRVFQQPGRGLTTAAEIVRAFGGKIVALPQRGGARIAVLFPAAGG